MSNLDLLSRELEVLNLLSVGYTGKEIAKKLYFSEGTIKRCMSSILLKLEARNTTHAVVIALKRGWIKEVK